MEDIVLICNRGSFAAGLIQSLESKGCRFIHVIDSKAVSLDLNLICSKLDLLKEQYIGFVVLFVSGETRDEKYMELMNYDYPKSIFLWAVKNNLRFIYLSSLSVFSNNNVDSEITHKSVRRTIDEYGRTKNMFDNYVIHRVNNCNDVYFSALMPASFYSGNGRSSIEKAKEFMLRYPFVFKNFVFPGSMSFVSIQTLYDEIFAEIHSDSQGFRIISQEKSLSVIRNEVFDSPPLLHIPNVPVRFWYIIDFVIPKSIVYRLKLLFTRLVYEEE